MISFEYIGLNILLKLIWPVSFKYFNVATIKLKILSAACIYGLYYISAEQLRIQYFHWSIQQPSQTQLVKTELMVFIPWTYSSLGVQNLWVFRQMIQLSKPEMGVILDSSSYLFPTEIKPWSVFQLCTELNVGEVKRVYKML